MRPEPTARPVRFFRGVGLGSPEMGCFGFPQSVNAVVWAGPHTPYQLSFVCKCFQRQLRSEIVASGLLSSLGMLLHATCTSPFQIMLAVLVCDFA